MGIFSDLVVINDQGTVTNVYTVFRSLLEDYTLPGVYVISFCLGIFSSWCTKRLLQHDLFSIGIHGFVVICFPVVQRHFFCCSSGTGNHFKRLRLAFLLFRERDTELVIQGVVIA